MTETGPGKEDTAPAEQLDAKVESDAAIESEDENHLNADETDKSSEKKSSVEDIEELTVQKSAEDCDTKAEAEIEEQAEDNPQQTGHYR